jgi:leucyl-tRNA synthetase
VVAGDSPAQAVPVPLLREVQRTMALLLAPFAPYLTHELWEMLGEQGSLLRAPWPKYDALLAKDEVVDRPFQLNGRLRSVITVPADAPEDLLTKTALADEKIKAAIGNMEASSHGKATVKAVIHAKNLTNVVVQIVPVTSDKK